MQPLAPRRISVNNAAPRPGHDVAAETTKRKREDAENILPCLADLLAPWSRDHIPTPPRAMTKLFDATCVPTAPKTPAPSDAFHITHAALPSPTA
jgi:hypothetical protein